MDAGGGMGRLRYKSSHWHNPLVMLAKTALARSRRYKMSCRRNLLFSLD